MVAATVPQGWRADLEFVVRRREEILEGKYERAPRPVAEPARPRPRADPDCPVCRGKGWEHYEDERGAQMARRCKCWKVRDG
ncbi:MAG: hypothetical protein JRI59_10755 [Deltaproteobacteria bacterium]|nr:hypothetical protein [Deltaproteobacteria bacterium]